MISLINSITQNYKLKNLFKKATSHGLFSLNFDTYAHMACKAMVTNKDIVMLHVGWNLEKIVTSQKTSTSSPFQDIECGFYTKRMVYKVEYFDTKLMEEMEKGKTIFVMFNLSNYFLLDIAADNNSKEDRAYTHHCTCAIFEPTLDGNYNCFYINSHGIDMMDATSFEVRLTRTRKKELKFDEPIDVLCLKAYFKHMKPLLHKYCTLDISINYDETKKFNYYGTNLQAGDNYGICFSIPLVIWYYLGNYYNERRVLHKDSVYDKLDLTIPCVCDMLQEHQLLLFVNSCFAEFHKDYGLIVMRYINDKHTYSLRNKTSFCVDYSKKKRGKLHKNLSYTKLTYREIQMIHELETFLEKKGTHIIKRITSGVVLCMTQTYIKRIIDWNR